ncbi:MAG TPA: DUF6348 family protein [Steroidobacteraceae bacterium]|nr:DUF6348 family protein [Steroidobacteraceae bacterium]
MFSWFRKPDRPPRPAAENPGRGHYVRVDFKSGQKAWQEEDDLAISLTAALNTLGHKATVKGDWVELEGGFSLLPQVVSVEPMDSAGVKTSTTIQTSHSTLAPGGVFEFQHSTGSGLRDSFDKGFKSWAEYDLPVFHDAQRLKAQSCLFMTAKPDRRVVLGPPVRMAQKTDPLPGDHDFCPCCLFTSSIGAFEGLVNDEAFFGIRLFVSRDTEGHIEADCRVNGVDRPEGAAALARYAQSWPDRGFEYRKQYVCIQTREPAK